MYVTSFLWLDIASDKDKSTAQSMAKVPVKYDYQIVNYRKKWSNYANQKVWWVMLKFEIDIFRVSDEIPFKTGAWHITGLMKHARNINFFPNQIANNLGHLSADR